DDSLSIELTINPNPILNMKDTIKTAHPDTVILRPNVLPNTDYLWQDASNGNTFAVSDTGYHWVIATNNLTGCYTQDSTFIKLLVPDVGMGEVLTPVTNCGYGIAHRSSGEN
ncbi:MAG: hypothetical protein HC905_31165, partial [Bacteroidales bacterium]|nr:hypothetical protein [Bacteroidales bacterium]